MGLGITSKNSGQVLNRLQERRGGGNQSERDVFFSTEIRADASELVMGKITILCIMLG